MCGGGGRETCNIKITKPSQTHFPFWHPASLSLPHSSANSSALPQYVYWSLSLMAASQSSSYLRSQSSGDITATAGQALLLGHFSRAPHNLGSCARSLGLLQALQARLHSPEPSWSSLLGFPSSLLGPHLLPGSFTPGLHSLPMYTQLPNPHL